MVRRDAARARWASAVPAFAVVASARPCRDSVARRAAPRVGRRVRGAPAGARERWEMAPWLSLPTGHRRQEPSVRGAAASTAAAGRRAWRLRAFRRTAVEVHSAASVAEGRKESARVWGRAQWGRVAPASSSAAAARPADRPRAVGARVLACVQLLRPAWLLQSLPVGPVGPPGAPPLAPAPR